MGDPDPDPDPDLISTSYVERQDLTMRMGMPRSPGLTNGFSKKVENLAHAVSFQSMHDDFARPPVAHDQAGGPARHQAHPGHGRRGRGAHLVRHRHRCSAGLGRVIALGLAGSSGPEGRDLTIDTMNEVARRLSRKYPAQVSAIRYGKGWHEIDGFMVWTGPLTGEGWMGPTLYVPVRRRLSIGHLRGDWREVESVAAAAARIGRAVRPDSD